MKTSKTTSSDIRQTLYEVMTGVLNGTVDTKKANSAVKAASGINQSIRFDLEAKRIAIKASRATIKPLEI